MSKRLQHRGRYPKASYMQQKPATNITGSHQMVQPPPVNEVPFYNVQQVQQSVQSTEHLWQPQTFGASTSLPSSRNQQVHSRSKYVHGFSSSYAQTRSHENNVWDWAPKNGTSSDTNNSKNITNHITQQNQYQQLQQQHLQYPMQQHQPQNMHVSQPASSASASNNPEYVQQQQQNWYTPTASENQNSSTQISDKPLISWDPIPSTISQSEQVPWTYITTQSNLCQNVNSTVAWSGNSIDNTTVNNAYYNNKFESNTNWQPNYSTESKVVNQLDGDISSQPESIGHYSEAQTQYQQPCNNPENFSDAQFQQPQESEVHYGEAQYQQVQNTQVHYTGAQTQLLNNQVHYTEAPNQLQQSQDTQTHSNEVQSQLLPSHNIQNYYSESQSQISESQNNQAHHGDAQLHQSPNNQLIYCETQLPQLQNIEAHYSEAQFLQSHNNQISYSEAQLAQSQNIQSHHNDDHYQLQQFEDSQAHDTSLSQPQLPNNSQESRSETLGELQFHNQVSYSETQLQHSYNQGQYSNFGEAQNQLQQTHDTENVQYKSTQENQDEIHFYMYSENIENLGNIAVQDSANIDEGYCEQEQRNGTVSNFFSDSIEENLSNSHEPSPSNSVESQDASISSVVGQKSSSVPPADSDTGVSQQSNIRQMQENSENTSINQGACMHQPKERSPLEQIEDGFQACEKPEATFSPSSMDEPINQEVPDSNDSFVQVSQISSSISKDYFIESPEEPPNQQIPPENKVAVSETRKNNPETKPPDKLILSHREDSPFKPLPPKSTSSVNKGTIVQQESESETCVMPGDLSVESSVIHEVNLETFPDNLERPPDHDELLKLRHSSMYRQHLKDPSDTSLDTSSTSLFDSPDIPCITLAPAVPLPLVIADRASPADLAKQQAPIETIHTDSKVNDKELTSDSSCNSNNILGPLPTVAVTSSETFQTSEMPISVSTPKSGHSIPKNSDTDRSSEIMDNITEKSSVESVKNVPDIKRDTNMDYSNDKPVSYDKLSPISRRSPENNLEQRRGSKDMPCTTVSQDASHVQQSSQKYASRETSEERYTMQNMDSTTSQRNTSMGAHNSSKQDLRYLDQSPQMDRYAREQYQSSGSERSTNVRTDNSNVSRPDRSKRIDRDANSRNRIPHNNSRDEYHERPGPHENYERGMHPDSRDNHRNKPYYSDYEQPYSSRDQAHEPHHSRNPNQTYNPNYQTDSRIYTDLKNKHSDYEYSREKYASFESDNPQNYRNDRSQSFRELRTPKSHHSDYDYQTQRYKTPPRSADRDPHSNQQFPSNYSNYDDRGFSDREGSRPPSRMSLNESREGRGFYDYNYQRPYASDYERSPSRASESELQRPTKQSSYPHFDPNFPPSSQQRERENYYRGQKDYKGYDYDVYRDPSQAYYGHFNPYLYNYNSYNYGFHDELYRNDPRYRQQVDEQYREYYRQCGYDIDRMSSHSGRSSANELTKERLQDGEDNSVDSESSLYSQRNYGFEDEPTSVASVRLTPAKFSLSHPFANFTNNGLLISLRPKLSSSDQTALIEIHNTEILMASVKSHEEYEHFQGPLIRGETHKNGVIDFCLQKVKFYKQVQGIADRESYVLLWELLVLLLRQNGSVAGSDIAELLLKDHEVLRPSPFRLASDTPLGDRSPADSGESAVHIQTGDASSPDEGIVVTRDKTILNAVQTRDIENITRKFREFLLFGHKKDALEWAMKHDLWGHALFLASKMDWRTHANIMTRFANSLTLNDPLQTLYQQMSGRQPAAVTCVVDKHWGDWRPHLAMILSNPSARPELDLKSVTTLGDTLAAQGCLPAAHFCYIMAQVEFGYFSNKNSKLVLLGADHRLPFDVFATNEAIQCTEIYEYAQSLANPGFLISNLQSYKFIYALRLIDHGYFQEALHYLEVLSGNFILHHEAFSYDLMMQTYEMACKLKYYDPHYMQGAGECEDQDDPEWLIKLNTLLVNIVNGTFDMLATDTMKPADQSTVYTENITQEADVSQPLQSQGNITNQSFYNQETIQTYPTSYPTSTTTWNAVTSVQTPAMPTYDSQSSVLTPNQYQTEYSSSQWTLNSYQTPDSSFNQQSHQPQLSNQISSQFPPSTSPPINQSYEANTSKFDFYGTENQQHPPSQSFNRDRTSSTSSMVFQNERKDSTRSSNGDMGIGRSVSRSRGSTTDSQKTETKEVKQRPQIGRSWLGGIFSKFLPKPPNQMILPEDKNPAIIWDEKEKRWVNNDSDGDELNSQPVAPPTDVELMNKSPSDVLNTPQMPPIAAASTPVTNKFQRAKTKGMRQNYVDILNTSNATTKISTPTDALFPQMPFQQAATNFFVPPVPSAEDAPVDFVSRGEPQYTDSTENSSDVPTAPPPMFDPAEFDSRRSSIPSIRHSVGPARRTYPT